MGFPQGPPTSFPAAIPGYPINIPAPSMPGQMPPYSGGMPYPGPAYGSPPTMQAHFGTMQPQMFSQSPPAASYMAAGSAALPITAPPVPMAAPTGPPPPPPVSMPGAMPGTMPPAMPNAPARAMNMPANVRPQGQAAYSSGRQQGKRGGGAVAAEAAGAGSHVPPSHMASSAAQPPVSKPVPGYAADKHLAGGAQAQPAAPMQPQAPARRVLEIKSPQGEVVLPPSEKSAPAAAPVPPAVPMRPTAPAYAQVASTPFIASKSGCLSELCEESMGDPVRGRGPLGEGVCQDLA